jgi:hypothetical protein
MSAMPKILMGVGALMAVIGIIMLGVSSRKPVTDPSKRKMQIAGGVMLGFGVLLGAGGGFMMMKGAGAEEVANTEGASVANAAVAEVQKIANDAPSVNTITGSANTQEVAGHEATIQGAISKIPTVSQDAQARLQQALDTNTTKKIADVTAQVQANALKESQAAAEILSQKTAEVTANLQERLAKAAQTKDVLRSTAAAKAQIGA